jgi:hypothetical protein
MRVHSQLSRMNCQEVLDEVQFGGLWRQGHQRDVGWHDELRADVPPGLIQKQHGVG